MMLPSRHPPLTRSLCSIALSSNIKNDRCPPQKKKTWQQDPLKDWLRHWRGYNNNTPLACSLVSFSLKVNLSSEETVWERLEKADQVAQLRNAVYPEVWESSRWYTNWSKRVLSTLKWVYGTTLTCGMKVLSKTFSCYLSLGETFCIILSHMH